MPAFGDALTPDETRAVIEYLRTWGTAEQRELQAESSRSDPFPSAE